MKLFDWVIVQAWAIFPIWVDKILQTENFQSSTVTILSKSNSLLPHTENLSVRNNIAILPVTGIILPTENLFSQLLGATTLDTLACDIQRALDNPAISEVLLSLDSPGGMVTGVHECAEMIYQARGKKPITAYVSGMAASAAYWLASSCDEIVMDATASVGSIGVLSVHTDDKQRKANQGLSQISIVSSQSPRKRLDVATDEGKADIQAQVDAIADVFVANVARNRNVSVETVLADFGQGSLLVGEQAVKNGLADRLGSLQQLLQAKTKNTQTPFISYQPTTREIIMTETRESIIASITVGELIQFAPAVAASLSDQGVAHERERIRDIEALEIPGHEALIQKLKSEGATSDEAAKQVLAAEKVRQSGKLNQLQQHSLEPLPIARSVTEEKTAAKPKKMLSIKEQCEIDWQKDSALQAEFDGFETYLAFAKAKQNNQVKMIDHA
jgi:capsid assembly protease